MIKIGDIIISNIFIGSTQVSKVYLGNVKVWPIVTETNYVTFTAQEDGSSIDVMVCRMYGASFFCNWYSI